MAGSPEVAKRAWDDGTCFAVVDVEVIGDGECLEEHEAKYHADVAIEFLEVVLGLFVDFEQRLCAFDELDDHLVVDEVEFPGVPTRYQRVVLVH